ncbi:MAG: ornithine acetyltransferase [Desulfocapsa sp.]|nr:MAG: ornithine acetyltransferase [Desulfocapsa sp.]
MEIKGFFSSAVAAGIRYKDRLDLGLIYSDTPAVTAGVFTRNQVKAAPVIIDQKRLKLGRAQAILVNSGSANACTGKEGMDKAFTTSSLLSSRLKIDDEMVLLSSTGVIGEQLNLGAFRNSMDELVRGLSEDNFKKVANAIMTTDTVPKLVSHSVTIGDHEVKFMGMAKGAGMIMPNMATMLSFVITDAQISFPELQDCLRQATARTFNRITIDGDTSTNDMVLVMANGTASNAWIDEDNPLEKQIFQDNLEAVLKDLALQIVNDGEGASKCITIRVCGARTEKDAELMARTVANSPLVKTAFFGEDANWGRILMAMGRSGVRFDPENIDVAIGDVVLVRDGLAVDEKAEKDATKLLKERNIVVCIDLKDGVGCEEMYTCDFSLDYIKINADYRS